MIVGFDSSSSINGLDKILGCESLPLSRVCLIGDEVSKFATSCVKKNHSAIASIRSGIND